MKLETFFEKFDQFADAPNAVARMRELILQLAAHGKLVEQSLDDEPASALVRRIEKHIEASRSRKIFRGSQVEPLDREELPDIPLSWEWVRLGNVVDYGSSDKAESADIPENAWLLDLEDIEKDTSRLLQRKSFRDNPSKSTKTAFIAGDVLYGKLRPYLNKVIVADASGYCTTEIIPIRAFGFIVPAFLCFALKRPEFIAYANTKSYGMNLPRLGTEDARRAPFPLPPLAEQKRIAEKLDELMALCDRLEAQQQELATRHAALAHASLARFADAPTPANLNLLFHPFYTIPPADLRKSILTLAVQGKLVPQDPDDEAVDNSVRYARRKARIPARALTELTASEVPFEAPESWRWVTVADVAETRLGKMLDIEKNRGEAHPYLRNTNVHWFRFELESIKTMLFEYSELDEYRVKLGDVLICEGGHGIARSAVWDGQFSDIMFQKALHRVRPLSCLDGHFLTYCLWVYERDGILQRYYTGAGIPHFTGKSLAKVSFPLPPLAEQRRIVAQVDQLMVLVDQLEAQLAASRSTAANLLEALVAELAA